MMLKGYTELGPPVSDALSLIEGSQRLRSLKSPKDAPAVPMAAPPPLGSKRCAAPAWTARGCTSSNSHAHLALQHPTHFC
jgi:hypothetical protein